MTAGAPLLPTGVDLRGKGMLSYSFPVSYNVYKPLIPNPHFRWSVAICGGLTTLASLFYLGTKIYLKDINSEIIALNTVITAGGLGILSCASCCFLRFFSTQKPTSLSTTQMLGKIEAGTSGDDYLQMETALDISVKELERELQILQNYCSNPQDISPKTRSKKANASIDAIIKSFKELMVVNENLQIANQNKKEPPFEALSQPTTKNISNSPQTLEEGLNSITQNYKQILQAENEAHQKEINQLAVRIKKIATTLNTYCAITDEPSQDTSALPLLQTLTAIYSASLALQKAVEISSKREIPEHVTAQINEISQKRNQLLAQHERLLAEHTSLKKLLQNYRKIFSEQSEVNTKYAACKAELKKLQEENQAYQRVIDDLNCQVNALTQNIKNSI